MEKRIAYLISILFHPVFIPTFTVFALLHTNIYITYTLSDDHKQVIYYVVLFNTALVPALMTFYLYKKKFISSMHMHDREERWFPFIITTIFYVFTYYLLRKFNFPTVLLEIILGASVSLLIFLACNRWTKISAHMMGIGGAIGVMYALIQIHHINAVMWFTTSIMIAGFVAFARLKMGAHRPHQIILGLAVGFIGMFSTMLVSYLSAGYLLP